MKFEFFNTAARPVELGSDLPQQELIGHLVHLPAGQYDHTAAAFFAATSAWSYGNTETFADIVCRRGMDAACTVLLIKNDALFVDTVAYLVQSKDRKLVFLTVRGTGPTNLINWLMNASVSTEPFFSQGRVHGGFFRSGTVMWTVFKKLLVAASEGKNIHEVAEILNRKNISCIDQEEEIKKLSSHSTKMEALYMCGHSLGGALAVLAAAAIHMDPELSMVEVDEGKPIRIADRLRGVYTYGQPRVCDPILADMLQKKFGDSLHRHVYNKDLVPSLPPRTTGHFDHFGHEYNSDKEGVWVRGKARVGRQAISASLSVVFGIVAWLKEQTPFLRWLRLPYSWDHHAPIFYMRTSEARRPGQELL